MLGANEVKAVIVAVDAVVDAQAIQFDIPALNHPDGMIGAGGKEDIAHGEVAAAVEQQVIGPVVAADPSRRENVTAGTVKLRTLPVDGSQPFDESVFGVDGIEESHVAITEGGVSAQRDRVCGAILLAVGGTQQFSLGRKMQRDVAFQLNGADNKHARRHKNDSALILTTGVNRRLNGAGVERGSVPFGAKGTDVVDAGALISAIVRLAPGFESCARKAWAKRRGNAG